MGRESIWASTVFSLLVTGVLAVAVVGQSNQHATRLVVTELEFRLTSEEGAIHVTEDQWRDFVEQDILPLFRDVQERDVVLSYIREDDEVVREAAKVVSICYPTSQAKRSHMRIERIRRKYREKLKQDKVLRFDFATPLRVFY